MDVPVSCRTWEEMMEGGEEERRILDNLRKDPCIDGNLTAAFFSSLCAQGDPKNPEEARSFAYKVVEEGPYRFSCQGREVPAHLFSKLFRIETVSGLRYSIPGMLQRLGITDRVLDAGPTDEQLRSLTDEYDGPVELGNGLQIVWASDFEVISPLADNLRVLSDRLGLDKVFQEGRCIVCVYGRDDIQSLHVPRAFDAIDMPMFEVVVDCSADYGKTKPLSLPLEEGLPEAVNRSCTVIPISWEMRTAE